MTLTTASGRPASHSSGPGIAAESSDRLARLPITMSAKSPRPPPIDPPAHDAENHFENERSERGGVVETEPERGRRFTGPEDDVMGMCQQIKYQMGDDPKPDCATEQFPAKALFNREPRKHARCERGDHGVGIRHVGEMDVADTPNDGVCRRSLDAQIVQ